MRTDGCGACAGSILPVGVLSGPRHRVAGADWNGGYADGIGCSAPLRRRCTREDMRHIMYVILSKQAEERGPGKDARRAKPIMCKRDDGRLTEDRESPFSGSRGQTLAGGECRRALVCRGGCAGAGSDDDVKEEHGGLNCAEGKIGEAERQSRRQK